jgi:hypothetical protein
MFCFIKNQGNRKQKTEKIGSRNNGILVMNYENKKIKIVDSLKKAPDFLMIITNTKYAYRTEK